VDEGEEIACKLLEPLGDSAVALEVVKEDLSAFIQTSSIG
jgi:hypothetical protein